MRLRTQLAIAFFLLAVLPLLGVTLYTWLGSQRAFRRAVAAEAGDLATEMSTRVDVVADGDPLFTHVDEGDDDMSAHVKAALLRTSEQVPVTGGDLALGTWQGLYVWEHRSGSHRRHVAVHVAGE